MGNSQGTTFRGQFDKVELRERTKTDIWVIFACTRLVSPPSTQPIPNTVLLPVTQLDASLDEDMSVKFSTAVRRVTTAGEGTAATKYHNLTLLKLNNMHKVYKLSLSPPRNMCPEQVASPSQYKLQYDMMETARTAMLWIAAHPHPSLIEIHHVEFIDSEMGMYGMSHHTGLERVVNMLPLMCPTEILYGLHCIASALSFIHQHGMWHLNINWDSIYVAGNTHEHRWVIGDVHMMSSRDTPTKGGQHLDQCRDFLSELRGLRDPKSIPYVSPEVNNPYIFSSMHASGVAIAAGAADMFSFGVMLDQILNLEKTRLPSVCAGAQDDAFQAKNVIEMLRLFAKLCMSEDPRKRPSAAAFSALPCVKRCTYVEVMSGIDAHLQVVPPFPAPSTSGGGVPASGAATTQAPSAPPEQSSFWPMLHLQLLKLSYEAMHKRVVTRLLKPAVFVDPETHCFAKHILTPCSKVPSVVCLEVNMEESQRIRIFGPTATTPESTAPMPTQVSKKTTKSATRPHLASHGILQPSEYQPLVSAFLRSLIAHAGMSPSATSSIVLARLVLRHLECFVCNLSFSNVVTPRIVPFITASLRHPSAAVASDALSSFITLYNFVSSAKERGSDMVGATLNVLHQAFDTDIFGLACSDTVQSIRIAALSLSARSILAESPFMTRSRCVACLCSPFVQSLEGNEARCTASRCASLVHRFMEILTPVELTQSVIPALCCAYQTTTAMPRPAHDASKAAAPAGDEVATEPQASPSKKKKKSDSNNGLPPTMSPTELGEKCLNLVSAIYEYLGKRQTQLQTTEGAFDAPPEDAEGSASSGDDDAVKMKRAPIHVGLDGWCNVMDPTEFHCEAYTQHAANVVPRSAAPPSGVLPTNDVASADECLATPADAVYSFHDYDNEWNLAPIFNVQKICAAVLNAASHVSMTYNAKMHPMASLLPSRCISRKAFESTNSKPTSSSSSSPTVAANDDQVVVAGGKKKRTVGSSIIVTSSVASAPPDPLRSAQVPPDTGFPAQQQQQAPIPLAQEPSPLRQSETHANVPTTAPTAENVFTSASAANQPATQSPPQPEKPQREPPNPLAAPAAAAAPASTAKADKATAPRRRRAGSGHHHAPLDLNEIEDL